MSDVFTRAPCDLHRTPLYMENRGIGAIREQAPQSHAVADLAGFGRGVFMVDSPTERPSGTSSQEQKAQLHTSPLYRKRKAG